MEWLRTNIPWVFSGIGVFLLSGIVLAVRKVFGKRGSVDPTQTTRPSAITVTLEELVAPFNLHTSLHAETLVKQMFQGKRVTLRLPVGDVSTSTGGGFIASFYVDSNLQILAYFERTWRDRLNLVKKGDVIQVAGRIERVKKFMVVLEDCEVIDTRT